MKINTVLGLYEHDVNGKEISRRLLCKTSGRMTPMMFEFELIKKCPKTGARAGILERDVMDKMAKITFNWFLSVKIALSTYDAELRNMTSMPMTWFCCIGLAAAFAVIWVLAHWLIRRKENR